MNVLGPVSTKAETKEMRYEAVYFHQCKEEMRNEDEMRVCVAARFELGVD